MTRTVILAAASLICIEAFGLVVGLKLGDDGVKLGGDEVALKIDGLKIDGLKLGDGDSVALKIDGLKIDGLKIDGLKLGDSGRSA